MHEDDIRNDPEMQLFFKAANLAALGCIAFAFVAPIYLFVTLAF
ncbi:hypothetical protein [Algirhabdus cladophorae]